jgi:hypothetical protein
MQLPPWIADQSHKDNWQTVAKVRAQTEIAGASSAGAAAQSGETASAITTFADRHHDF